MKHDAWKNRLLGAALAATLAGTGLGIATPALASSFTDIPQGAYYAAAIDWANDHGIMTGTGPTTFDPESPLTCYQLAVMLWRIGDPDDAKAYNEMTLAERSQIKNETGLPDVGDGQWYTPAANWAYKNGIITGYAGTAFGGGDYLTSERFVTIIARFADPDGLRSTDGSLARSLYADSSSIQDYARQSAVWARQKGVLTGYPNENGTYSFKPQENINRGRAAQIIRNASDSGVIKVAEPSAESYTVRFDKNASSRSRYLQPTGTMADQEIAKGSRKALTGIGYSCKGYEFQGWNTKPDGSGTSYGNAQFVMDLVKPGETITLYAQWKPVTYIAACDLKGGTLDGQNMLEKTFTIEDSISTPQEKPVRDGYEFAGWTLSTSPAGTDPVETISQRGIAQNITFVANWKKADEDEKEYYSINLSSNNEQGLGFQTGYARDELVSLPKNGTKFNYKRDGYEFAGWNTKPDGSGISYADGASVYNLAPANGWIELYAQWKKTGGDNTGTTVTQAGNTLGFYEWLAKNNNTRNQAAVDVLTGKTNLGIDSATSRSFLSSTTSIIDSASSATSLDNLEASLKLIKEGNRLRASEGRSALRVDTALLASSEVNANWCTKNINHAANQGQRAAYDAENAAWGSRDPYDGWYTDEKANYQSGHGETGHYTNLISTRYSYTGFGMAQGGRYGVDHVQQFGISLRGASYTPDELLSLLNTYKASLK